MPSATLLLLFVVTSGRIAVIGGVSSPEGELPRAGALAEALKAQGGAVVPLEELRRALFRGGRQRATHASPDAEALWRNAARSFDVGDYPDVIRRAQNGQALFALEEPSVRREELRRQVEILWGGALVQLGKRAEGASHFERALVQDPESPIDRNRFPPPVQEAFERARAGVVHRTQVRLEVSGPEGLEGATLLVDGLTRAVLPHAASLIPHPGATVWVESRGQSSLAREVDLGTTPRLGLNWGLESALRESPTELGLFLPLDGGARKQLLALVAALATAEDVVTVERKDGVVLVTRVDGAGEVRWSCERPVTGDWSGVARELLDEGSRTAIARERSALDPSRTTPEAPPPEVASPRSFPWLVTGLIAGGVLVVAGGVVLAMSIHGPNAVLLGPSQAQP